MCSCDLNAKQCDPFCCCDSDCSPSFTQLWKDNSLCEDVTYLKDISQIYPLSECLNSTAMYEYNS